MPETSQSDTGQIAEERTLRDKFLTWIRDDESFQETFRRLIVPERVPRTLSEFEESVGVRVVKLGDSVEELKKATSRLDTKIDDAEAGLTTKIEEVETRLTTKIEEVETRLRRDMAEGFEHIDQRFDHIDQRFDHIDQRFGYMDQRFDQIAQRFNDQAMWMRISFVTLAGMMAAVLVKVFFG